jgi:hypothetical protein
MLSTCGISWGEEQEHYRSRTRLFVKKRKNYVGRRKPKELIEKEKEEAENAPPKHPYKRTKYTENGGIVTTGNGVVVPSEGNTEVDAKGSIFTCIDCMQEYIDWDQHSKVCKPLKPKEYWCRKCQVWDNEWEHLCINRCSECLVEENNTIKCIWCCKSCCKQCITEVSTTIRLCNECNQQHMDNNYFYIRKHFSKSKDVCGICFVFDCNKLHIQLYLLASSLKSISSLLPRPGVSTAFPIALTGPVGTAS